MSEEKKSVILDGEATPAEVEKVFMDVCWGAINSGQLPSVIIGVLETCTLSVKHSLMLMWTDQVERKHRETEESGYDDRG